MPERLDVAIGAAGVAGVVLAALLFVVLPEEPRPTREFLATFEESTAEAPGQQAAVADGQPGDLAFEVARGNLSAVEVRLRLLDDLAASDPDALHVELIGPDGTVHAPALDTANPLPLTVPGTPPTYAAVPTEVVLVVAVHDKPTTQVLAAASPSEDVAEAGARLAGQHSAPGAGTWTVRVTVRAGDCPDPSLDPQRATACRAAAPDGDDAGNPVEVVQFRTRHWDARLAPV